MKRLLKLALFVCLAAVLLSACTGSSAQPLAFTSAPWADGEVNLYDVTARDGALLGTAQWSWRRSPEGWTQAYELTLSGRVDRGEVVVGPDLRLIRSWREVGGKRFDAEYGAAAITVKTTEADGTTATKTLKPPADGIDNDVSLQLQRALPLAAGYATRYEDVIPTTGAIVPVHLRVTGAETITVPAGTFPAWRVEIDFGSGKHDAWYAQDAPHALLKYVNRASGAMFVLTTQAAGQAAPGGATATPTPQPAPDARVKISTPVLLSSLLVQAPLMLIFPLGLGWWIRRRHGIGWGVFGVGALTFVASQVVHLPLNYALGLLGGGRGVALWPLPWLALVAGLSAGLCEEGARWVVLRFFLKRARGWRPALQFGAGHGGAESIIFGLLALVSLIAMVVLSTLDAATLGLPAEAAGQINAARTAYWSSPWYLPMVGGAERLFAIAIQIALTQVVMLSFTRRNIAYLFAAIGLHAAVDFWAVLAMSTLGTLWTEVGVALMACAALWLIWRLRDAGPTPAETPPVDSAPTAADLAPRELSPEELARRAETSRYE